MTGIAAILLAAGSARRFGGNKLMQPLADGTAVGIAAVSALREVIADTLVVVRPDDVGMTKAFSELGVEVIENPLASQGMSTSLVAGVEATVDADGWLIALADMPWIQAGTIQQLVDALGRGASLVAPVYDGRRGHPVGFAHRWGEQLRLLKGDRGARDLIAAHVDELQLVETRDRGVLLDVDYPADLQLL